MAQTRRLDELVNINCPLADAHAQLIPKTIQEVQKIQRDRMRYETLKNMWFITGDGCVYAVEKEEAVLYFTNTMLNPVLKNIADATFQIKQSGNYNVKDVDLSLIRGEADKENGGAKRYSLSDLRMSDYDYELSFYDFDTVKYDQLNNAQRAFAEQIHGNEKQFMNVMDVLNKAGITMSRISFLNPKYVKKIARDGPAARVGRILNFDYDCFFDACNNFIGDRGIYLRGAKRR